MDEQENRRLAQRHLAMGYRMQRVGRLGDALEAYRHAIALFPTAEGYIYLAKALSTLGRYEEAIEYCQAALALDPDDGDPYGYIGAYLIELERWEEARSWLELALSAPHGDKRDEVHYHLGRLHHHFGNYQSAAQRFRAALSANPNLKAAQDALAASVAAMN